MASGPNAEAAPSVGQSTQDQLQAYIKNLPQLLNTTAGQTTATGQALQGAHNTLDPESEALITSLYNQYAPQLQQTDLAGGIANASTNLSGQGSTLINQAVNADKQANPEYYAARASAGSQLNNLLGSINLGGLTGSESAQVERANAQSDANRGLLTSPSQTATVSNAMNFGTALQNKQNLLANAISTATSFLPASKSGVDAFGIGSGTATSGATAGNSQFLNPTQTAAGQASTINTQLGNSLLGGINTSANTAATANANLETQSQKIHDLASPASY